MKNNIIEIKQKPIYVYSGIDHIAKELETRLQPYLDGTLVVTEDNLAESKKLRTSIRKEHDEYKSTFKRIKEEQLKEWNEVESYYKEHIDKKFSEADSFLKRSIDQNTEKLHKVKLDEIVRYFNDLKHSEGIDWLKFESISVPVTLSKSMKSIKELVLDRVSNIKQDIEVIQTQDNKERIMVEYQRTLDLAHSIHKVTSDIVAEQKIAATPVAEVEGSVVEQVQEQVLTAPTEVDIMTVSFKITDTKEQIIKVRDFMRKEGIKYE